jgi:hypothetical protein
LLTKKTPASSSSSSSGASQIVKGGSPLADMATGRFTFQKRHLYFSLVLPAATAATAAAAAAAAAGTSPEADASIVGGWTRPPRYLQFLSEDGNILEEQELTTNDYYNATGKVYYYSRLSIIIISFFLSSFLSFFLSSSFFFCWVLMWFEKKSQCF